MGITGVIKVLRHHILVVEEALLLCIPLELQEEDTVKAGVIITDPEIITHQRVSQGHPRLTMGEEAREEVVAAIGRTGVAIEDQRTEVAV